MDFFNLLNFVLILALIIWLTYLTMFKNSFNEVSIGNFHLVASNDELILRNKQTDESRKIRFRLPASQSNDRSIDIIFDGVEKTENKTLTNYWVSRPSNNSNTPVVI